jgi:hypothetical protein
MRRRKSLRRKLAFSSRADLHQGTTAQEELNTVANSGPIYNSDYIGQPSAHSEAQCKRPAQYPPAGRGYLYWPPQLAAFSFQAGGQCRPLARNRHADAVATCPLLRDERTWLGGGPRSENVEGFGCRPATSARHTPVAGVRKPPRKEPAGDGARRMPRTALWGFG